LARRLVLNGAASARNMRTKLVDPVLMPDERYKWNKAFAAIFVRR
jgi:hypothetical protein